jgi:hypothetical protein
MVPVVMEKDEQLTALGTGLQLRMLGEALGVVVATTILNEHLQGLLGSFLSRAQVDAILESPRAIALLEGGALQGRVRRDFGEAYNLQMRAAGGFSAAQVLVALLVWKRGRQVRL